MFSPETVFSMALVKRGRPCDGRRVFSDRRPFFSKTLTGMSASVESAAARNVSRISVNGVLGVKSVRDSWKKDVLHAIHFF